MKPKIVQSKCISCENCLYECPTGAITMSSKNRRAYINQSKCVDCGRCIDVCPVGAIRKD